jgi:hypothetical protein
LNEKKKAVENIFKAIEQNAIEKGFKDKDFDGKER